MKGHKIGTFWTAGVNQQGYRWNCECGARGQICFGTPEAALIAGEDLHVARYQSPEEIQAKRQEEHNRIKARSQEILDRFIA